ncbi:signal peptide peptidase SppA [Hippea jasoniae]|uniref:signal peptide peptidase SppA n=1 Tax=Hippea jasoniae TaxID=944479 RepID=UPI0006924AAA|nr:signal peptide peptidase SppA [Hippea jasoniae]
MLKKVIKYAIIGFLALFVFNMVYYLFSKPPNVAVIKLTGVISTKTADDFIKNLKKAQHDPNIKAILIKINSPGGDACASQRIYLALKNTKKFIVALIKTIGASGAYFAACGADKIVAYPTSIVGSIGVIFETLNFSELAKRAGVNLFVVKTGKVKDFGNPFRKPDKQDIKMIYSVLESIYNQFLEAVSTARHIPIDKLKSYADGSVFSGKQAKALKLIDSTKGIDAAEGFIKQNTGIKHIKTTLIENKNPFDRMVESFSFLNYLSELTYPTFKAIYQ